jgi:hypothetical protein
MQELFQDISYPYLQSFPTVCRVQGLIPVAFSHSTGFYITGAITM